jgi:hypothetical protein
MGTNRTIPQSKDDLKAAADQVTQNSAKLFRTTYLEEPTQIRVNDLPLFSVLNGIETDEVEESNPEESLYDMRYSFDTVMVFNSECTEAEVIAGRNAYLSKLYSLTDTADTYPWRIERHRIYVGHWGNVKGWFVTLTFSRYTCEDFR